jgi:hypothetical protein
MAVIVNLIDLNLTVPINCQVCAASPDLFHAKYCILTNHGSKVSVTLEMVGAFIFRTISEIDLITVLHPGTFLLGPFLGFFVACDPHVSFPHVR